MPVDGEMYAKATANELNVWSSASAPACANRSRSAVSRAAWSSWTDIGSPPVCACLRRRSWAGASLNLHSGGRKSVAGSSAAERGEELVEVGSDAEARLHEALEASTVLKPFPVT